MTYAMFLGRSFSSAPCFSFWAGQAGKLRQKPRGTGRRPNAKPPEGWPKVALIIPMAGERQNMDRAPEKPAFDQDYPWIFIPVLVTATEDDAACKTDSHAQGPNIRRYSISLPDARKNAARKLQSSCRRGACGAFPGRLCFLRFHAPGRKGIFCAALQGRLRAEKRPSVPAIMLSCPGTIPSSPWPMPSLCFLMRFCGAWRPLPSPGRRAGHQPYGTSRAMILATLWSSNVVDDCSLAALLQKDGVHIRLCPAALLENKLPCPSPACLARLA